MACVGYGIYLLHGGTAVPGWLVPVAAVLGLAGAVALWASPRVGTVAFAVVCALLLPGVAAALMVTRGLGPFAAPYEPASATISRAKARSSYGADEQVVDQLASTYNTPIPLATDSSILAAPFILATGAEVLPIGGFQGGVPSPTLARLQRYIAAGEVRALLVPVHSNDPRIEWVHAHCAAQGTASSSSSPTALYVCGG